MMPRTLRVLLAIALAAAGAAGAASAQQEETLLFHKRPTPNGAVHQMAIVLPLPPSPPENPEPPSSTVYDEVALDAAIQWMVEHGYLFEVPTQGVSVTRTPDGNSLVITAPGVHIVILLPSGPFLPEPWPHRLMTASVLEIYNGF